MKLGAHSPPPFLLGGDFFSENFPKGVGKVKKKFQEGDSEKGNEIFLGGELGF